MIIWYVIAVVVLFNLWALFQIAARKWLFHGRIYRPHLLNVALSWAPNVVLLVYLLVALALLMLAHNGWLTLAATVIFLPIWLLFLPNASYLITELNLNHRSTKNEPVPLWYDIISVLSLALTGVLNAVSSIVVIDMLYIMLRHTNVERLLPQVAGDPWFWLITAGAVLLSSFGIYLGRYLRLNSWDFKRPWRLFAKVWRFVVREHHLREALLYTLFFSVFLFLFYLLFIAPAVALLGM